MVSYEELSFSRNLQQLSKEIQATTYAATFMWSFLQVKMEILEIFQSFTTICLRTQTDFYLEEASSVFYLSLPKCCPFLLLACNVFKRNFIRCLDKLKARLNREKRLIENRFGQELQSSGWSIFCDAGSIQKNMPSKP